MPKKSNRHHSIERKDANVLSKGIEFDTGRNTGLFKEIAVKIPIITNTTYGIANKNI